MKYVALGLLMVSARMHADVNFPPKIIPSHRAHPDAVIAELERNKDINDLMVRLNKEYNERVEAQKQKELQELQERAAKEHNESFEAKKQNELRERAANAVAWRFFCDAVAADSDKIMLSVWDDFKPVLSDEQLNELSPDSFSMVYEKAHEKLKSMQLTVPSTVPDEICGVAKSFFNRSLTQATAQAAKMVIAAPLINEALDKISAQVAASR